MSDINPYGTVIHRRCARSWHRMFKVLVGYWIVLLILAAWIWWDKYGLPY